MAGDHRSNAGKQIPGFTSAKKAAHEPSFENYAADGTFSYARAKAAGIRAYAASHAHYGYGAQSYGYERAERSDATVGRKNPNAKARLSFVEYIVRMFSKDANELNEKKVSSVPMSKSFIASVLLCTVMLMVVLFTYSSYTQLNNNVELLENEKQTLIAEQEQLESLLAVRDDIREIEDYATNVIGMVKSDYVETRYVSVADGERIEVISAQDEEEDAGNLFSTLLSAMGGNWERVLEYID